MAKRITEQDIEAINEAYLIYGTYSGAAKAVGCSASTARKYVIPGYKSKGIVASIPSVKIEIPQVDDIIITLRDGQNLSLLTSHEKQELRMVWARMNF